MEYLNVRIRAAFTLVELLIAIIIIAVLSAISAPKFSNRSQTSKESAARAELDVVRGAIARFNLDTGVFPNSPADLKSRILPSNGIRWDGSSWRTVPVPAPWNGPYLSAVPSCTIPGFQYDFVRLPGRVDAVIDTDPSGGTNPYRLW